MMRQREIRRLPRHDAKEIVIVAMTANAFCEDVQQAMEAGMNGHIAKPVDMNLLSNTLTELLQVEKVDIKASKIPDNTYIFLRNG